MQTNITFLSVEVHYCIALLLMNAYSTHLSSKQIQHIFTDGHTQACVLGAVLFHWCSDCQFHLWEKHLFFSPVNWKIQLRNMSAMSVFTLCAWQGLARVTSTADSHVNKIVAALNLNLSV